MGVRAWSYLRPRPGDLRPLSQRAVEAFVFRDGRLPVDEEGFVKLAEVLVLMEDRRAVEALRVGYFQHRALSDGTLDREHHRQVMAAAGEAAFGALALSKPPPGVVAADHRFAKRRLDHMSRWEPTRAELERLCELVNPRAGRKIL